MPRLTVQSLLDYGLASRVAQLCSDNPLLYQYINAFEERALLYGRWWGTTQLMRFCATPDTDGVCVVLPREVETVEAINANGSPVTPRNAWWPFSYRGAHASWSSCCGSSNNNVANYPVPLGTVCRCGCGCGPANAIDKLTVPCFATTTTGQKIRFTFDPVDVGKTIIVQGYDSDNIWVRTLVGSTWIDGEQVTLATTGGEYYTDTTTEWYVGSPTAIIKQTTNKRVLMFAADDPFASGDTAQQLASYEPSETHPSYRKLYLPSVRCSQSDDCTNITINAIVSLRHIPVSTPNDWLLFENHAAYFDGVQSERMRDNNDFNAADRLFFGTIEAARNNRAYPRVNKLSGAIPALEAELRKKTGDLSTIQMRQTGVFLQGFV